MWEALSTILDAGFMPHGHCYLWQPDLLWTHAASDGLIGLSYVAISVTLYRLVRQARLPFSPMILAFGLFIGACGLTHLMEVWNIWHGHYWAAGGIKVVTALASAATAIWLVPLVPSVLRLAQSARLAEAQRVALEAKNRELRTLNERVTELSQAKARFFANVSHELRTPLTLILGPLDRLRTAPALGEAERRELEQARSSARLLLKQVNDLLEIAKLEVHQTAVRYARVDVAELVRRAAAYFGGLGRERDIGLHVEVPAEARAELDPEQLERVLVNLLGNAFKFTPAGGQVRVSLAADAERCRIEVADSGPGVAPGERQAIFERFRRGEGGHTSRVEGSGLGLSIAKELVELHRGTIAVGDAPEGGALFTVELPALAPTDEEVSPPPASPASLGGAPSRDAALAVDEAAGSGDDAALVEAQPAPGAATVLVIEDHPEMARFLTRSLAKSYHVVVAGDGRSGMAKALGLRPDLVVMDVMMPGPSGEALLGALRGHPELDAMPILVLTASQDDELRVRLLRAGAQDFLGKPFLVEELEARAGNLVALKRARDILQRELETRMSDLEALAQEAAVRKHDLEIALGTMRLACEEAESASTVKSMFLSLVSHELLTPLQTIQLNLDALRRKPEGLGPRQTERLGRVAHAAQRLVQLIRTLLEYTRIDRGLVVVNEEPIDLVELGREVLAELEPDAERKRLELRLSAAPVPPLWSDPRLVRLMLHNLVMNGIKYTDRGHVEIVLGDDAEGHHLSVRDTGHGIPEEARERIFEPFSHLEPIRQKHASGMGLGLALVRELVRALGGQIRLDSRMGQGSSFTITLPPRRGLGKSAPGDTISP